MDETTIDLRDRRGRLIRLAISATVGILVVLAAFQVMESVIASSNTDAITKSSMIVTAVVLWVFASGITLTILTAVTRWARRRAG